MGWVSGEGGSTVLPCHPAVAVASLRSRSGWLRCPFCGSFFRAQRPSKGWYDSGYPERRRHHDPVVGECKQRGLARWMRTLQLEPESQVACEIGFGGGWCLRMLQDLGARVSGLEPIAENRRHAASLGIAAKRIFDVAPLPRLPEPPTLWLLLDSFEHVDDPSGLVEWMARESPPASRILLVAPDAGALSRKLMGRFWLHNVPDHWVHYSSRAVEEIFGRVGFRTIRRFRPVKCVSLGMAWNHAGIVLGKALALPLRRIAAHRVWFNLGEMGLLLERHAD